MTNKTFSASTTEQVPNAVHIRIKKLFTLAERGGTEAEAETAAAQAQRLLTKYGLEASAVLQTDESDEIERVFLVRGRRVARWRSALVGICAAVNECRGARVYDEGLRIYGRPHRVAAAVELHQHLEAIVDRMGRAYKRRTGAGRSDVHDYRCGMVATLNARLQAAKAAAEAEVSETALVCVGRDLAAASRAVEQAAGGQTVRYAPRKVDMRHFEAGCRDGRDVSLHAPKPELPSK